MGRINEMGLYTKWMDDALGVGAGNCDTKKEMVASHSKGLTALTFADIRVVAIQYTPSSF